MLLTAAIFALALILSGLLGRSVAAEPHCAACRFSLVGLPQPLTRCPECGLDLARPRTLRHHRRQASRLVIILGLSALPLIGMAAWLERTAPAWYPNAPAWYLRTVIAGTFNHSDDLASAAFDQLEKRLAAPPSSPALPRSPSSDAALQAAHNALDSALLNRMANRALGWPDLLRHGLLARYHADALNTANARRFRIIALDDLELQLDPVARSGGSLPIRVVYPLNARSRASFIQDLRSSTGDNLIYSFVFARLASDAPPDRSIPTPRIFQSTPFVGGQTELLPIDLGQGRVIPPGRHTVIVELDAVIAPDFNSRRDERRRITLTAPVTVTPPEVARIKLATSDKMTADEFGPVRVSAVLLAPPYDSPYATPEQKRQAKARASLVFDIEPGQPLAMAFDVRVIPTVAVGNPPPKLPPFTLPSIAKLAQTGGTSSRLDDLPDQIFTDFVAANPTPAEATGVDLYSPQARAFVRGWADVILTPSIAAAEAKGGIDSIWDAQLTFRNVPIYIQSSTGWPAGRGTTFRSGAERVEFLSPAPRTP